MADGDLKRYVVYGVALLPIHIEVLAEDEFDAEEKAQAKKLPVLGVNPWAREGSRDPEYWKASDIKLQADDRHPVTVEEIGAAE